jgi:hypothetical protein
MLVPGGGDPGKARQRLACSALDELGGGFSPRRGPRQRTAQARDRAAHPNRNRARCRGVHPGAIDDVGERLLLYKRIANAPDRGALDALVDELADASGAARGQDFVRVMATPGIEGARRGIVEAAGPLP